jgi:hypothetical protein
VHSGWLAGTGQLGLRQASLLEAQANVLCAVALFVAARMTVALKSLHQLLQGAQDTINDIARCISILLNRNSLFTTKSGVRRRSDQNRAERDWEEPRQAE